MLRKSSRFGYASCTQLTMPSAAGNCILLFLRIILHSYRRAATRLHSTPRNGLLMEEGCGSRPMRLAETDKKERNEVVGSAANCTGVSRSTTLSRLSRRFVTQLVQACLTATPHTEARVRCLRGNVTSAPYERRLL